MQIGKLKIIDADGKITNVIIDLINYESLIESLKGGEKPVLIIENTELCVASYGAEENTKGLEIFDAKFEKFNPETMTGKKIFINIE